MYVSKWKCLSIIVLLLIVAYPFGVAGAKRPPTVLSNTVAARTTFIRSGNIQASKLRIILSLTSSYFVLPLRFRQHTPGG